jgi:micrococcal nuclease
MKRYFACTLFLALTVSLCAVHGVKGASLFGKVIEINDGDAITIFNMNRPVRVRLMGIDAPENDQSFGDVAKKHLSDLVYDKFVSVEYSGLGQNSSLQGRVLINGQDVGAQMIRDGVAWYDPSYKNRLTEAEFEVYIQSEQAARNEKRGLWQADSPIPPWEFVKGQGPKREVVASQVTQQAAPSRTVRPTAGLNSESLLSTEIATGAFLGSSRNSEVNNGIGAPATSWQRLQPAGENFSALVPSGGKQSTTPVPFGDQTIEVNYYMARDGLAVYTLMWMTGPTNGESDAAAIKGTLSGFTKGVGAGYESRGGKFICEPRSDSDISSGGYSGREFDLRGCTIPAMARAYTKVAGGQRQMYVAAVFYDKDETNVSKFLDSFNVNSGTSKTRVAVKATR